ncbi:MAG: hypothetical protein CM1200mP29_06710 [Verrucomicrobiota bacterium]|nr:MAG: hypothetical protein CM1200mP29_06710 [Verrucomicrobiota bacterium]
MPGTASPSFSQTRISQSGGVAWLGRHWKGLGGKFDGLVDLAGGKRTATPVRQAAINAIRETGGAKAVQVLKPLGQAKRNSESRPMAVTALAALNLKRRRRWPSRRSTTANPRRRRSTFGARCWA